MAQHRDPSPSSSAGVAAAASAAPLPPLTGPEQYLCGVVGGIGKVITGHPFDTVKSRVQAGAFDSATEAAVSTFRKEGAAAFYQGVLPPCVTVGVVSGIMFWANAEIRRVLQPDPEKALTYTQMGVAGGGSGALTAVILTPLDQMKLWLQVEQRSSSGAASKGPAAVSGGHLRRVAGMIGPMQLYRGFAATALREIGTFGIFFPLNEYLKATIASSTGVAPDGASLPLGWRLAAAGTAGVLCWLPCYPIDQIKSRQQLQGHPLLEPSGKPIPAGSGRSMAAVAGVIWRTEGTRGFMKGIGPCLLRAFPTYAAQFTLFDALSHRLRSRRAAAAAADA